MRYLKTFSTCLVALALHGTAWAQIYETTDAAGNPDFTNSPPDAGAEVVNLPETNVIDAPPPQQQEESQPETVDTEQAPAQINNNNTVNVNDGNDNDGYDDAVYQDNLARQREIDRANSAAPGEVGDPGYEMPREVGDSESQMPHEVGDSESQMPHEVGDFPAATGAQRR